jgi:hypothetical protein
MKQSRADALGNLPSRARWFPKGDAAIRQRYGSHENQPSSGNRWRVLCFLDPREIAHFISTRATSSVQHGDDADLWLDYLAAALGRPLLRRRGAEAGAALGAARLGRLAVTREDPVFVCTPPPVAAENFPQADLAGLLARRRVRFTDLYLQLRRPFQDFSR